MHLALTSHAVAAYLDAALNHMHTAVFLVDAELHLLHANAAGISLLEHDTVLRLHGDKLLQNVACGDKSLARMVRVVLEMEPDPDSLQALSLPRNSHHNRYLRAGMRPPPRGDRHGSHGEPQDHQRQDPGHPRPPDAAGSAPREPQEAHGAAPPGITQDGSSESGKG